MGWNHYVAYDIMVPGFFPLNLVPSSTLTDMSNAHLSDYDLSADLSGWDVSSVTNMAYMFGRPDGAGNDRSPRGISGWDISSVISMEGMFARTGNVAGLENWDISSVQNFNSMFETNIHFDGNVLSWKDNIEQFKSNMFSGASAWHDKYEIDTLVRQIQPLTDGVLRNALDDCLAEDSNGKCDGNVYGPIADWDVSQVTNMSGLFKFKRNFDGDIGDWDVSNVVDMSEMFYRAESFNKNLNWDVSNVRNMDKMFFNAHEFNGRIDSWDVSKVTSMDQLLYNARRFTSNIGGWTYHSSLSDFTHFFTGAAAFNVRYECPRYYVRTSGRCTDDVDADYIRDAHQCATAYNSLYPGQSFSWSYSLNRAPYSNVYGIKWWHVPPGCVFYTSWSWKAVYLNSYVSSRLCSSRDKCLCKDTYGVHPSGCALTAGRSVKIQQFELSKAVENCLAEARDDGKCNEFASYSGFGTMPNWDTSEITSMRGLFKNYRQFNADIKEWDVSKVRDMSEMFENAFEFAQDISTWSYAENVDKTDMFKNARRFFRDCEETKCYKYYNI